MTPEEKIKGCLGRHPEWDDRRVAVSCSVRQGDVQAIRAGQPMPEILAPVPAQETAGFVSLEKIAERYDVKAAIFRELKNIPKGKLISEAELCGRVAGQDRNRFRRTCENNAEEFRAHRLKLKLEEGEPKYFWGAQTDIAEAQRMRDL